MGSSIECVGVARELTLVIFFQIVGEQGHTFGYLGRWDSGHIILLFVQQRVVSRYYYFCL